MNGIKRIFLLSIILVAYACVAHGYVLHIGDVTLTPQTTCDTEHKLWFRLGNDKMCIPMTTEYLTNTIHVRHNGIIYSGCDGTCGGGEYIMPETPPDPIVLPTTCEWTQTNPKAYLLSDGNQYFDTKVKVDSTIAMDLTAEIVDGKNARLVGVVGGSCFFDMSINDDSEVYFRIGTSTYSSVGNTGTQTTGKHLWEIKNNNSSGSAKYIYQDGKRVGYKAATKCTGTNTILVFHSDHVKVGLNPTENGGMKLYSIKMYNKSGKLLHDYQPVAKGTDICGTVVPTNAMWDFVDKKLYYPAGTGQMGYGVDP